MSAANNLKDPRGRKAQLSSHGSSDMDIFHICIKKLVGAMVTLNWRVRHVRARPGLLTGPEAACVAEPPELVQSQVWASESLDRRLTPE